MFGVMTVLSLDYEIKNRTFFKCKCNRCSNLTSVRSDHLLKNPKSCSFCTNNLQKEIADKYFDYQKAEDRSSPGNKDSSKQFSNTPKTQEEFEARLKDPKITPKERIELIKNFGEIK